MNSGSPAETMVRVAFVATAFPSGRGIDCSARAVLTTDMELSKTSDAAFLRSVVSPIVIASEDLKGLLSTTHFLVADVRSLFGDIIETIVLVRPQRFFLVQLHSQS